MYIIYVMPEKKCTSITLSQLTADRYHYVHTTSQTSQELLSTAKDKGSKRFGEENLLLVSKSTVHR